MKKLILTILLLTFTCMYYPQTQCRRGDGGAVAAGVGIGLMTGVIASKVASDNRDSRYAEQEAREAKEEARRAREETQDLRKEQETQRVHKLERKIEKQKGRQESNLMWIIFISIIFALSLAVGILFVMFLRK